MGSKIFSYKVAGIVLETVSDELQVSRSFDRKEVINKLKELFKDDNYKVDERTLDHKIKDGQLYIEGLAVKQEETRSIGFMTGK